MGYLNGDGGGNGATWGYPNQGFGYGSTGDPYGNGTSIQGTKPIEVHTDGSGYSYSKTWPQRGAGTWA